MLRGPTWARCAGTAAPSSASSVIIIPTACMLVTLAAPAARHGAATAVHWRGRATPKWSTSCSTKRLTQAFDGWRGPAVLGLARRVPDGGMHDAHGTLTESHKLAILAGVAQWQS